MGIAEAIIAIITTAPTLINEVTVLYNSVKGAISTDDQETIDALLAAAIKSDADATARADLALTRAAQN